MEIKKDLKKTLLVYKIAVYTLLLVVIGLLWVHNNTPTEPLLTPTEDTTSGFVDTTFTMQTRSNDAIVMQFEINAKLIHERDIYQVKTAIYEQSLKHGVLWFYETTLSGQINDEIWLPNATIQSVAFEQMFMDMVAKSDSLNGSVPIETQLPISVIK